MPNGGVDDDRQVAAGAVHLSHAIADALQSPPHLRGAQVDIELVAFGISHDCIDTPVPVCGPFFRLSACRSSITCIICITPNQAMHNRKTLSPRASLLSPVHGCRDLPFPVVHVSAGEKLP